MKIIGWERYSSLAFARFLEEEIKRIISKAATATIMIQLSFKKLIADPAAAITRIKRITEPELPEPFRNISHTHFLYTSVSFSNTKVIIFPDFIKRGFLLS